MAKCKDPGKEAERIRKISEARRGEKNPFYGKSLSEEHRRKMSEALKGKPKSEEHRRKISEALRGMRHSEETRRKISEALRGEKNPFYGKSLSEEQRRKISEAQRGRPKSEETRRKMSEARRGMRHSEETRRKISEARRGRPKSEETRRKMSEALRGMRHSEETRRKMSEARKGKPLPEETRRKMSERRGERNPRWNGGISFEPYCPKFNREFKERVRSFFGYRCAECGEPQNGYKLHVHHVNFNKMSCCDNTPPLFVPLCRSCHARTQKDRDYWEEHFTRMINEYHGGACYFPKEEAAT